MNFDKKDWVIAFLIVIQIDLMMTLVGTHKYGLSAEENPVLKEALTNGDFVVPLVLSSLLILFMFFILKLWFLKTVRLFAWSMLPIYIYESSFAWIFIFITNHTIYYYI